MKSVCRFRKLFSFEQSELIYFTNIRKSYNSEKCKTAIRLKLDFQYINNLLVGHKYTWLRFHCFTTIVVVWQSGRRIMLYSVEYKYRKNKDDAFSKELITWHKHFFFSRWGIATFQHTRRFFKKFKSMDHNDSFLFFLIGDNFFYMHSKLMCQVRFKILENVMSLFQGEGSLVQAHSIC